MVNIQVRVDKRASIYSFSQITINFYDLADADKGKTTAHAPISFFFILFLFPLNF